MSNSINNGYIPGGFPVKTGRIVVNKQDNGFARITGTEDPKGKVQLISRIAATAMGFLTGAALITAGALLLASVTPVALGAVALSLGVVVVLTASVALAVILTKEFLTNNTFEVTKKDCPDQKEKFVTKNAETNFIVCQDSMESFEWKKRLIQAAKKEIILSGNYCGGKAFDEVLELLHDKLKENEKIKVVLLTSTRFVTEENKKSIAKLEAEFPDRFLIIPTDDVRMMQGIRKLWVTNHTKGLSIDGGVLTMQGGDGLEDKYAYHRGIGDRTKHESNNGSMFLNAILPRGFRDMSVVMHSGPKNEEEEFLTSGQIERRELIKLAKHWQTLNRLQHVSDGEYRYNKEWLNEIDEEMKPSDSDEYLRVLNGKEELVHEPISCEEIQIFATGPENASRPFYQEILEKVRGAKDRIDIAQLYFHPDKELSAAFVEAVNRGVKLRIVTNGSEKYSPGGHKLFGHRNRWHMWEGIRDKVDEDKRDNIKFYEYGNQDHNTPRKTSLHKKVTVIDNHVFMGSSNLGHKSLVTQADYELNFVASSSVLADQVIKVIDDDVSTRRHCEKENGTPLCLINGKVHDFNNLLHDIGRKKINLKESEFKSDGGTLLLKFKVRGEENDGKVKKINGEPLYIDLDQRVVVYPLGSDTTVNEQKLKEYGLVVEDGKIRIPLKIVTTSVDMQQRPYISKFASLVHFFKQDRVG
ncbi:MAG: hypothetical protein H7A37_06760 [Chlamydiales bacterium]|nr:hypothetical protein [Chlamydiia bacterium]MCP5507983.1 hypothetical protein [Chlamydiales bacterium]